MDQLYIALLEFHTSGRTSVDYLKLFEVVAAELGNASGFERIMDAVDRVTGNSLVQLPSDIEASSDRDLEIYIGQYIASGGDRGHPKFRKLSREAKRRGLKLPFAAYYLDGHFGDNNYLIMEHREV